MNQESKGKYAQLFIRGIKGCSTISIMNFTTNLNHYMLGSLQISKHILIHPYPTYIVFSTVIAGESPNITNYYILTNIR